MIFVNLPFPARQLYATPLGMLIRTNDSDHERTYRLERGIHVLPSVGDPVFITYIRTITLYC